MSQSVPPLLPVVLIAALLPASPVPAASPASAPCTTGAAPMLAGNWPATPPPLQHWLFSEKLDGVRARWDGRHLTTRQGNRIAVPAHFTRGWPAQPMDGELWAGRGQFDAVSALVRRADPQDQRWQAIRFHAFDLPCTAGDFAHRHQALQRLLGAGPAPHLALVRQLPVADQAALQHWLRQVLEHGGEGLMAHHRHARYHPGRSPLLLKIKPWHDAEATVTAHLPGQGKYRGHTGALRVRDDQGREFAVGSGLSDALRQSPPALGSRITYRYTERTAAGLPRFPRFVRVRDDEPALPRR